jgi:hypothetical protein
MKTIFGIAALAASCFAIATPALAQRPATDARYSQNASEARFAQAQQRLATEFALYQTEYDRYQAARSSRADRYDSDRYGPDWNTDDRDEGSYDPARNYRAHSRYRERALAADERIYRGRDGRYYCKRNDGTTGLIVGAVAGGVLGNLIDGGHSRAAGTILGAIAGGAAGRAIERNNYQEIRCR